MCSLVFLSAFNCLEQTTSFKNLIRYGFSRVMIHLQQHTFLQLLGDTRKTRHVEGLPGYSSYQPEINLNFRISDGKSFQGSIDYDELALKWFGEWPRGGGDITTKVKLKFECSKIAFLLMKKSLCEFVGGKKQPQ